MQRRFVSDVSHELRTPLTTVRMAADVIHEARDGLRPGDRAVGGAAAGPARPVRVAARRPAGDQPVRRGRGGARRGADRPARRGAAAWSTAPSRSPSARAADHGARRRAAGRSPRPTRAGSSASCATCVINAIEHGEGRDVVVTAGRRPTGRWRSRCGTTASGSSPARRPGSSTGSGGPTRPAPAPPAARDWGCRSPSEDARLHGGWLQAWGEPGGGSQFRLTLPRTAGEQPARLADPAGAQGLAAQPRAELLRAARPPGVAGPGAAHRGPGRPGSHRKGRWSPTSRRYRPADAPARPPSADPRHCPAAARAWWSAGRPGGRTTSDASDGGPGAALPRAWPVPACGVLLLAGCASMPSSGEVRKAARATDSAPTPARRCGSSRCRRSRGRAPPRSCRASWRPPPVVRRTSPRRRST